MGKLCSMHASVPQMYYAGDITRAAHWSVRKRIHPEFTDAFRSSSARQNSITSPTTRPSIRPANRKKERQRLHQSIEQRKETAGASKRKIERGD